MNRIFDWKIELDLRVKTGKDWRHNDAALRRLIER
jgi:GTP-binding protein Era